MKKTNVQLQQDVLDELQFEPSVDAAEIGVTAKDGIITLTGKTKTYSEKWTATKAAERVSGVNAVVDQIKVDLSSTHERNDEDVARTALQALEWNVQIPHSQLIVKVEDGYITLEGQLDYNFQRIAAVSSVRNLMGVKGVIDLIKVKPTANPIDVKEKIEKALKRAAEVDSHRIHVEVSNDRVTLRGVVRSWAERDEAERAAWSATGVRQVKDELMVAA